MFTLQMIEIIGKIKCIRLQKHCYDQTYLISV